MDEMKAFIFDMDGVIVDTQGLHSQASLEAMAAFGMESTLEEALEYAGTARGTTYREIAKKRGIEVPVEEISQLKDRLFTEAVEKADLEPIRGIPALLKKLRAMGIPTAIASSSSEEFIAFIVDRLHIRAYFDELLSGQKLPKSKPDPAIYRLAAQALGVRPRDCVVLEDAALGAEAAKAAGMFCIGYRTPSSGNQDLSRADLVVVNIEDTPVETL